MPAPPNAKIYHITHARNLLKIASSGRLWSDAKRIELGLDCEVVGMSEIKRRRLEKIDVSCIPGAKVGHFVPFYFCPRSIMLFILYRGNHPDLRYTEGQRPMIHLQADLEGTIRWAETSSVPWAFSDRNAGSYLVRFSNRREDLGEIDWEAIAAVDFRNPVVKEGKQAEFLVFESFPWDLVEGIGVLDEGMASMVKDSLAGIGHRPEIRVRRSWYF